MKLEDYQCEGCRTHRSCGDCPSNDERIREFHNKYGDRNEDIKSRWKGFGFISD